MAMTKHKLDKIFSFTVLILLFPFLSISSIAIAFAEGSPTYYVSPSGDDSFNGLAPTAGGGGVGPWQTIDKVNSVSFTPGSSILFVRGEVFEGRLYVSHSGTAEAPITFGAYGTGDAPIIDGSDSLAITWVAAPEVGTGVWKTQNIPYEPRYMFLVSGGEYKTVPAIHDNWIDGATNTFGMTGFDALSQAPGATFTTMYLKMNIVFWDGLDALYGSTGGFTYIRFRDNDDPNTKDLRPAPYKATIKIRLKNYIVVQDLKVYGACYNIYIGGDHNIIDNCTLIGGQKKVYIAVTDGHRPSNNTVRNCTMTPLFLTDYAPGPWNNGKDYVHGVRENIYLQSKYLTGTSSSNDVELQLYNAGNHNALHNNVLHGGLVGFTSYNDDVAQPCVASIFYNNTVYNMSSVGVVVSHGNKEQLIYNNLVYNCNINLRPHRLNTPDDNQRSHYIYNNRFYNPEGVGEHLYCHYMDTTPGAPNPYIYIYHNSFSGGKALLSMSGYAYENGGLVNTIFVNNIFSSDILIWANKEFIQNSSMIGAFDYNWCGGYYWYHGRPAWMGIHNIETGGYDWKEVGAYPYFWNPTSMPDFKLPVDSKARGASIDVSQQFITIDGTVYNALPGMKSGYFSGAAPDLGGIRPIAPNILSILPIRSEAD